MLTVEKLVKTFPVRRGADVVAVSGVSLDVEEGELFTLLGPSGCGKSTTLRAIAGLERPDSGEIELGDRVLFSSTRSINVPANARHMGMVFQSYAIWPHLSVFDNVAFPLRTGPRRLRPARSEVQRRVTEVLGVVELGALADRPATNLSGGQQQRLALARALVRNSGLLLLDEPLSNLDAKLRESMRFELKRLQREYGITTVYVTHDQTEALGLSSRVAVMRGGEVMQVGKPREIYDQPANRFVADFVGTSNFIDCVVEERVTDDVYRVTTPAGCLRARGVVDFAAGSSAAVAVRPEQVVVSTGPAAPDTSVNRWEGKVVGRQYLGDHIDFVVEVSDLKLRVRCHPSTQVSMHSAVVLEMREEHCTLVPTD